MQQVTDWLDKLGMAEYAHRFAENRIDLSVLPHLTDQHLKELGVALGDRLKMLHAIGELSGASAAAPQSTTTTTPFAQDTAERRQLTVMFSDLVGSTALSARMDPEDFREIITSYQKSVAETVLRFDGFVAKYMGDGVLVYFGYPQAHEDDAERAVRAGLELISAVAGLKARVALRTRVGIATGLVVVGDLIGTGSAKEQAVIGGTTNLAARLQGIAQPDTVVVAENTRKLLGNLFELEDLGAKELKGIDGLVHAWAALRASSIESRFEALHGSHLTDFVGREEELESLLRRWSQAKTGRGQVVLLSGEAGIGKSRLAAALMERLANEQYTRLRYFCSPQHTDSALYPVIAQMERAAGLAHDDSPQTKLDKLDALLAATSTSISDATLFAQMLSLQNDGRYPVLELDPQQRRKRTMAAFMSQTEALTKQRPVMMVLEDAHWSDPTSLDLFGRLMDRIAKVPALLIVTFRPDLKTPWVARPHVTNLILNRMAQSDIAAMINRIIGNKLVPAKIRQEIVERADGIPLFVEEITKLALEADSPGAAEQAVAAIPPLAGQVPASLHASLMARLDRLGPVKEIAQIGAAIGREFPHSLLAAVVRKPETELRSDLDRLVEAGLLFQGGIPPSATYLFNHSLVQDAAYGTLLRETRRTLHARIAETLASQFTDIVERQPELLARHYTEAGLIEKAAALWGKAGQRSLERSAFVEAAEQLTRALSQIRNLPGTPQLRGAQIKLQVALITALMILNGPAAPETRAAAERAHVLIGEAEALGEPLEAPGLLLSVLDGFAAANFLAFDGNAMRRIAKQFLALAEKQGATVPRMIGHRIMGMTVLHTGDIAQGRTHYDQALRLGEHLTTRLHMSERMQALCLRSFALWLLGYPEAALIDINDGLSDARKSGHANDLIYALFFASWFDLICFRNYETAKALADELVELGQKTGALAGQVQGMIQQGCVLAVMGKGSEAVHKISSGLSARTSGGATVTVPSFLSYLAIGHAELGHFDEARRCIDEAITTIKTTKERWFEPEVHRIAGELELKSAKPDRTKAQYHFQNALAVAREQRAKSWELRTATSTARLLRLQGNGNEARSLLAPVCDWFTEGFDTLDLKDAKVMLDQLN